LLEGRTESGAANRKWAITSPAGIIAMLFIFGFSYVPIQGMTSSECSTTGIAAAATG